MNPIAQFLSLSLLLHISVIGVQKVKAHWPSLFPKSRLFRRPAKIYLSYFIIVIVSTFVFGCTSLIIGFSITDSHSNIRMIDAFVQSFDTKLSAVTKETQVPHAAALSVVPCSATGGFADNFSLVDQLVARNLPSDFDSRAAFAAKYHIPDYHGRTWQNALLVKRLQKSMPLPKTICGK